MATAPSDNGECLHFEATEAAPECSRNLQAAETEPRLERACRTRLSFHAAPRKSR